MATYKAVVLSGEKQENAKGEKNVKICLTHKRRAVYIPTVFYVKKSQIGNDGKIKYHSNANYINASINATILKYQKKDLELGLDIEAMTAMDLKKHHANETELTIDFYSFAERRIKELKESGKQTHISYADSIKRLKEFYQAPVLPFHEISKKFLEEFEQHCMRSGGKEGKGRSVNTVAVFMRSIRAIFYDAMDELNRDGMDPYIKNNPFFRRYKIKTEKTKKRNIDIDTIKKIRDAILENTQQKFARDMFMLQFYLIGINVKDLFYYKLPVAERIEYKRYKTTRPYSIKIEPEAREIIDMYKGKIYLLKFADHCGIKPGKKHTRYLFRYQEHRSFNKAINSGLKDISTTLELTDHVTTYYSRHSWATIARNVCGISKDDIALCLGHKDSSKSVTDIYLDEDLSIIDKSNRKVLDLLLT